MQRKDVFVSLSMDVPTARLLAVLADALSDGNRSLATRLAVREAAARRGLVLPEKVEKSEAVQSCQN